MGYSDCSKVLAGEDTIGEVFWEKWAPTSTMALQRFSETV
jgi:hypothetical protein